MLGERISSIRKMMGKNQQEFADMFDVKQATISSWETNIRQPDIKTLLKIADLGKCTLDWLLTGTESTFTPPINDGTNLISDVSIAQGHWYPIVGKVRAGSEMIFEDSDVVGTVFIDYHKKNSCFCVVVEGESMAPRLHPGDLVLVDPKETPLSGDIVVVILSDRQMVKKLHINKNGSVELHSFNSEYPAIFADREEIQAMFRVVARQPRLEKM
jgi:phage repressor protein C with HTH and peptisase S24 domain